MTTSQSDELLTVLREVLTGLEIDKGCSASAFTGDSALSFLNFFRGPF